MEEKIKNFFEGPGREAIEHLGSGVNILITIGDNVVYFENYEGKRG